MCFKQLTFCIVFVLFNFISIYGYSQEGIPVVKTYSVENYHAGIENWDAVQDNRGVLYFANCEGILEFDGIHWQLLPGSLGKKFRALAKNSEGKIYAAGDYEFGYLKEDKYGHYSFTSLKENCPPEHRNLFSHVWKIQTLGSYTYCLASGKILLFDKQNTFVKILDYNIYLRSLFLINNKLIAYSNQYGLLEFDEENLTFKTISKDPFILNRSLEFIAAHPNGGLRMHLFDLGFFRYTAGKFIPERKTKNSSIDIDYIFCKKLHKNILTLGTTINGLYILDNTSLQVKYHITKALGLNDNKIFSIYIDVNENIWVGHENGISYIKINTPIRIINETLGIKGTGLCSTELDSLLFAGTTNGLFASTCNKNQSFYKFSLVGNIRQPTYFIYKKDKKLLIGCLHQLYEYDGFNIRTLSNSKNNSKIRPLGPQSDTLFVANQDGLLMVTYDDGFKVEKKLAGLSSEIYDFVIDPDQNFWIIESNFTLSSCRLNATKDSLIQIKSIKHQELPDLKFKTISYFDNLLLVGTNQGLFYFDSGQKKLVNIDQETSKTYDKFSCNWIYNQDNTKLWHEKSYFHNGKLKYKIELLSEYQVNTDANSLNSHIYGNKAFSFEKLNKSQYAIGTLDGFLLFNQDEIIEDNNLANSFIRKITVSDDSDTTELVGLWLGKNNNFPSL